MILGTRKLWQMFPIKQKLNITAAYFYNKNVLNWSINLIVHCTTFFTPGLLHNVKKISKLDQIENFWLSKKAAVLWHFCLIANPQNNFLVPRMNEPAPKTFIPIQTPDLHRVFCKLDFCYFMLTKKLDFTFVFTRHFFVYLAENSLILIILVLAQSGMPISNILLNKKLNWNLSYFL